MRSSSSGTTSFCMKPISTAVSETRLIFPGQLAKSFTSALVGIAIGEGLIKSVDDPIVNYLPELKGRGFNPITIRNLLMMQSGIRYRIADFPWDEDSLAYYLFSCRREHDS
jgi:CubicO group peptidase (beta-lactamase class C family)